MANILLTNKCVRRCPYCFAGLEMAQSAQAEYMSWENLIYLADLLQASGETRVSLLGGEPTLHPDFVDMLLYWLERRFDVTVFTSGLMSDAKLRDVKDHIAGRPADRITFVCNLNNPVQTPVTAAETEKLEAFLDALGRWTMPAFNIYRSDFDLAFLFDLVARFGLKKTLRLGVAHPIPGAHNDFVRPEEIGEAIERLCLYKDAFESLRLKPHFDCGFPLCRIGDEQLGWMVRLSGHIDFKCRPAIDITPDMQVYCCFPLSGLKRRSVFEFDSFRQIVAHYQRLQQGIRDQMPGIYPECARCDHRKEATCSAGGACQLLNGLCGVDPAKLKDFEEEERREARLPS